MSSIFFVCGKNCPSPFQNRKIQNPNPNPHFRNKNVMQKCSKSRIRNYTTSFKIEKAAWPIVIYMNLAPIHSKCHIFYMFLLIFVLRQLYYYIQTPFKNIQTGKVHVWTKLKITCKKFKNKYLFALVVHHSPDTYRR